MSFDALRLYSNDDCYVLEPVGAAASTSLMVIFRDSGRIDLRPSSMFMPEKFESIINIWGVMGILRLRSGDHLVAITQRELIGRLDGHAVYRAAGAQMFPYSKAQGHLTPEQAREEAVYVELMAGALKDGLLHFSPTYDLTNSLQRQAKQREDVVAGSPAWRRADDRFFWNRHLQSRFIELVEAGGMLDVSGYILPVVHAFVEIRPATVNGTRFTLALISRRSRLRAGTRYFVRGADVAGNVANHVETEQIVVVDVADGARRRLSYVQARGSVPVHWAQVVNTKYSPYLRVFPSQDSQLSARAHFDNLIDTYDAPVTAVNLLNRHGYERPVADAYAEAVRDLSDPRVRYVHFDFHRECAGMRWDRIQLLIQEIEDSLQQQGWFYEEMVAPGNERRPTIRSEQHGVVRSSCMDSLDRTNVVQAALARWALTRQLRQVGVLPEGGELEHHTEFEAMYRHVWADNADAVSNAYAGTGALKTDFTRLGKRTQRGALADLQNSITRYVKNNYLDGRRQDAYDLFLGAYRVGETGPQMATVAYSSRALTLTVPIIMVTSILMFMYSLLLGTGSEGWLGAMAWLTLWLGLFVSSVLVVLREADQFIRWPKLNAYPYRYVLAQVRESASTGRSTPVVVQAGSEKDPRLML